MAPLVAEDEVDAHVQRQAEEHTQLHGMQLQPKNPRNSEAAMAGDTFSESESSDEEQEWEERAHYPEEGYLLYGSNAQKTRAFKLKQLYRSSPEEWLERCKHSWRLALNKQHRLKPRRRERAPLGRIAQPVKPLLRQAIREAPSYVKPSAFASTSFPLPSLMQSV